MRRAPHPPGLAPRSAVRVLGAAIALWALAASASVRAAPAAAPSANDIPVALPPFLVEEMSKGPPWRYTEVGGYEVLSRCSDSVTRKVIEAHHQLHVLLAEILPAQLQLKLSVPKALILYDEALHPAASQEVIARMLRDTPAPPEEPASGLGVRGFRLPEPSRRYSFLPNLRLWDRDSMSVFMIVRRDDFDADRLALTHDYIAFLVKSRLPALPLWFISGFLDLYRVTKYEAGRLSTSPMEWISSLHTDALKKDPKTAPAVQPLAEFFAGRFVAQDGAPTAVDPLRLWQAQATLVVRWGLDERDPARRAAFWRFVERGAAEGVTEELFRELFGFDYATAHERLTAYRTEAISRTMKFKPAHRTKLPAYALQNATDSQLARIKGDWERLEVPYVRTISPSLAPRYLEQARRTLQRAYARDERDPRLLAVMGLCEVDAGNDEGARQYLDAATRIGPMRPRAQYELARLRFAEARAKPAGAAGRLDTTQAAHVLTPLFAARGQEPPLPEVYELIADVWTHGVATPTRNHLAVLDEGVRYFPRRASLVVHAAELNLRHGFRDRAAELTEVAAPWAKDEATRARVAALQRQLGKPPAGP